MTLLLCWPLWSGCSDPPGPVNNGDIPDQDDKLCEIGSPTSLKLGAASPSSFNAWEDGVEIQIEAVPQGGVITRLNLLATGVPRTAKKLTIKVMDGATVLSSSAMPAAVFPCIAGLGRMRAQHTIGYQADFLTLQGRKVTFWAEVLFDDGNGGDLKLEAKVEGTLKL